MASTARSAPLTRVAVIGATGRMGQALLRSAPLFPQLIITGAVASAASLALGRDAGEVAGIGSTNLIVTSDLPRALGEADVVVDFSDAAAARANLAACRAAHLPLLIGTTGHEAGFEAALTNSAREIAVLVAPNTSIAVALLEKLVRASARALPASFDIDIVELHHRGKRDAPSGTALALRAAAAAGRPEGQIGIASVRAGDAVGEHTVLFSGSGEQLALRHRASDRAIFARGALTAALWLASRPPGHYTMQDFIVDKTLS
ncbi:MAG: 4-hydroxy-tetrahydrodipicolinate reductase [Steroidobacteraceae bacterium]